MFVVQNWLTRFFKLFDCFYICISSCIYKAIKTLFEWIQKPDVRLNWGKPS